MNEQITKNWFKLSLLLIIGLAFYWYEYRPSQVKKECYSIARVNVGVYGDRIDFYNRGNYDFYYKWCLEQKGL